MYRSALVPTIAETSSIILTPIKLNPKISGEFDTHIYDAYNMWRQ